MKQESCHYPLLSLSPLDGRYYKKTRNIADCFSEKRIIQERIKVEVEYFIELCKIPLPQLKSVKEVDFSKIRKINQAFNLNDAERVKDIEKKLNHDVKAVEYFIKEKFKEQKLEKYSEFIHFGLTSQDINNVVFPAMMKESTKTVLIPAIKKIISTIEILSKNYKNIVMLARTHGQPASPTTLSKEFGVFSKRLHLQLKELERIPYSAKFGGATGNMNAHYVSYPEINWHKFAERFLNKTFGLKRSYPTTQIEHYDYTAAWCHSFIRINTILVDFCRDVWTYISMDYFKQKLNKDEVGSSAMPHKVNPIDFENAEGNLMLANAVFGFLAEKLPVSRLQRDLTDSTVIRNIGVPLGHTLIALESVIKGLGKLEVNGDVIKQDLEKHPEVIAEAIQTILRREGYPNPYEFMKQLTRTNKKISIESIHSSISGINISDKVKKELLAITPDNYKGKE